MNPDTSSIAQCPQCQSRFRLTAQHLEAAKGWVQCGVCGHVFFSGLRQTASPAPAADDPSPANAPTPPATEPVESPAPQHTETLASANSATQETDRPTAPSPILSGLANRMAEDGPTTMTFGPKLESIILVDPNAMDEDHDPGPMPVIEPQAEPGRAAGLGSSVPPSQARSASATDSNWVPRPAAPATVKTDKQRKLPGWVWGLLAGLLILLLVTQLLWFMRDKLAANHPALRPVISQLCAAMDCVIGLPRDANQVMILGSDLQTEENGQLILTVNLANKAQTAMAWPVLELTLTDVEDQPMARRVFAPSEYLGAPGLEGRGIEQQSEVPIALTLGSSDLKAAGYRLRMFY